MYISLDVLSGSIARRLYVCALLVAAIVSLPAILIAGSGVLTIYCVGIFAAMVVPLMVMLDREIFNPLRQIEAILKQRIAGDLDAHVDIMGDNEIGRVASVINHMFETFSTSEAARQEHEHRVMLYAQELEGKTLELETARAAADQANSMKGQFLANMSHEIRTPMNGIIGMTELMLQTPITTKQKHYAETVLHSAEALLTLINDILDLSKVESGKLELEPVIFDMLKLCHEVVNLFSIKAQSKAVTLALDYAQDAPRYVVGDQVRVRQILSNLVSNAVKFTNKGRVVVSVETDNSGDNSLSVAAFRMKVTDTGIGISQEAQQKLFEKFAQADASTTRKYGGTGLGLVICKQLVLMMGGEIGLMSKIDEGSAFWFTLKLRHAATPLNGEKTPEWNDNSDAELPDLKFQNVRVLLVDDSQVDCEFMGNLLQGFGCEVSFADNGETAVEMVERGKFDLVLMDTDMPVMNGYRSAHFLNAMKNKRQLYDVPIIALISSQESDVYSRCQISGMVDCLAKPLRREALANVLLDWLPKDRIVEPHGNKIGSSLQNKHVLLAEDSSINQMVVKEFLIQIGCRVTLAEDGRQAVSAAEGCDNIDIILMDCHMPVMDGFEATKVIREKEGSAAKARVPIIALTALAMKGDRERCLKAGMDDYLSKPIRKDDLVKMLQKWVNKSGQTTNSELPIRKSLTTILDASALEYLQSTLGPKFQLFIQTYLSDTQKRLQDMEQLFATNGDASKIALHAHSICSSSAYVGDKILSELAASMELRASKTPMDDEGLAEMFDAMQSSFAGTREILMEKYALQAVG